MNLLIVESPTKARTLGRFLPKKEYEVIATVGHVRDLPKSKLGVNVEKNFEPDWVMVKGKRELMSKIRQAGMKAKMILLATDPDREGEAISWHVLDLLRQNTKFPLDKKEVKRITFHEITKSAVEEALKHADVVKESLVDAQQARRVVDRLVGYSLSPVLWRKIRRGLSAGRVQSVAVRLVVEKEREREAFKPQEYWEIYSQLLPNQADDFPGIEDNGQSFMAKLQKSKGKSVTVENEKQAESIAVDLSVADYQVKKVEVKQSLSNPSAPFTTSTLQQTAGQKLGYSAKNTMRLAQMLYEEGVITYHRTDAVNLSNEAIGAVRSFIESEYGAHYLPKEPKIYKTKAKVAQEAHEAIRPTDVTKTPSQSGLSAGMLKLYELIWSRFVACQMNPAIFDQTTISIEASVSEPKPVSYELSVDGKVRKFDGWLRVMKSSKADDEIPALSEGQVLGLVQVHSTQRFTEPPARFSEATLIKRLEQLGIGRPSTYAPTLSTILDRNYVEKVEGRLKPTAIGEATNDFLVEHFPNELDYQFTARMEDDLDAIANSEKKWKEVVGEFYKPFIKNVTEAAGSERVHVETESTGEQCPECKQGEVVIRIGKFGKFLSCSRFPDCKYTAKYLEKAGMLCPDCGEKQHGEVIIKTTRRGRKFYGCSRYPDCTFASWELPKKPEGEATNQESESAQ